MANSEPQTLSCSFILPTFWPKLYQGQSEPSSGSYDPLINDLDVGYSRNIGKINEQQKFLVFSLSVRDLGNTLLEDVDRRVTCCK